MDWKAVSTDRAPKPLGPYSQGIVTNGLVFVAGMVAVDPASGNIVQGGIKEQTKRVIESIKGVLEAAGSSLDKVTKVTVILKEASMFKDMNEVYSGYFKNRPTRATIIAQMIRPEMLVEMDAIAVL